MKRGDIVFDKETQENDYVVILTPEADCTEWYADMEEEVTVADQNPDYDKDQQAIVTALVDVLDDELPEWEKEDPRDLFELVKENGIKFYAFPENRLQKYGLTSDYNDLESYKQAVEQHYEEDRYKSQTWTLEETNEVEGARIVGIKATKSKVIFIEKDGSKITKDRGEGQLATTQ